MDLFFTITPVLLVIYFSADVFGVMLRDNGGANRVTISVRYTGRPSCPSGCDCLPADAKVAMNHGSEKYKRADELVEGDNTRFGGKVFMFTHRDAHRTAQFVRMETSEYGGNGDVGVLEVTPGHYVYVNGHLIAARDVRIGDWFRKSCGGGSRVVNIRHV